MKLFMVLIVLLIAAPSMAGQKTYSKAQISSARKVMSNVRELAKVYEDNGSLVVEFDEYLFPDDINTRLRFVRGVADADCVVSGRARTIFFYNPDGKQIAQADRLNGVRLK